MCFVQQTLFKYEGSDIIFSNGPFQYTMGEIGISLKPEQDLLIVLDEKFKSNPRLKRINLGELISEQPKKD